MQGALQQLKSVRHEVYHLRSTAEDAGFTFLRRSCRAEHVVILRIRSPRTLTGPKHTRDRAFTVQGPCWIGLGELLLGLAKFLCGARCSFKRVLQLSSIQAVRTATGSSRPARRSSPRPAQSVLTLRRDASTQALFCIRALQSYLAANQKHWPCNRLGRPFRDKGL